MLFSNRTIRIFLEKIFTYILEKHAYQKIVLLSRKFILPRINCTVKFICCLLRILSVIPKKKKKSKILKRYNKNQIS